MREQPLPRKSRISAEHGRTPWALAALAGVIALGSAACDELSTAASPKLPLWAHHPVASMSVVFRRELTQESRKIDEDYERGKPTIDPVHRRVFVGSSDHGLYALRAEDGAPVWRFETLGAVQSEPLYDAQDDSVYFGSNDGALYKVHAADGKLIWRFQTSGEVFRPPVIDGDTLYFTNANDTLVSVNRHTGEMNWHQHRTPAYGMEVAGYAGPALGHNGLVYTAFSDGVVMAYSTDDGSEQWPYVDLAAIAEQQEGDVPQYLDVDTTPIVGTVEGDPVVFVASYSGGLFALDADNGGEAWSNPRVRGVHELILWTQPAHEPRDGDGPMVPARRVLVASSGTTGLWGLDPENGRTLWRRGLPEGGVTAAEPVAGALLVGTTRYGLFLFSPLDGGMIDGIDTGGHIAMTPAAHGFRAYVMTNGGSFLGLTIADPRG